MRFRFRAMLVGASIAFPRPVDAQQGTTSSNDAFGTLVGFESIGLYGETQVRGFNLEDAGNYRIEGHYFVRGSSPSALLRNATTVRIGVNALRYDFPAPSGVIEYDLLPIPEGSRLQVETGRRALNGPFVDVVGSTTLDSGKLRLAAVGELGPWQHYTNGATGSIYVVGGIARWNPSPSVKLAVFGNMTNLNSDPGTGFVPGGEFLPREVKRGVLRSQPWLRFRVERRNLGAFGDADLGSGWKIGAAAFHSAARFPRLDFNLIEVLDEAGDSLAQAFVVPRQSVASDSASVTLERSWKTGSLNHRLVATARARRTQNFSNPAFQFEIGQAPPEAPFPTIPKPDFVIGDARTADRTKQFTVGAGYRLGIGTRVELRADLQKTDYSRRHASLDGTITNGKSRPWLYSLSGLAGLSRDLVVFASYSRGLEESGVAPSSASNRGEVLPAVIATQREVGARYSFTPALSLIAGLFDTRKSTPGIGPDGRFDLVGQVRHRGFEASLAGALTPRLNIVAGLMILDARLRGPLVDQKAIGPRPVATPGYLGLLNASWSPKGVKGLSLDATIDRIGRAYIGSSNITRSKNQNNVELGFRYNFSLAGRSMSVRGRVLNLFDSFYWQPDSSGTLYPNDQRDFELSLRVIF